MARTARASVGGLCYHVLNRGNGRASVFHEDPDYEAFVDLLLDARARLDMRILAYCLMPNHFHLVLWPIGDGDLSRWMQWLTTAHVRRHHRKYGSSGHVWQGRFKAFPIEQDDHLLTVLRYVERNALRAGLTKRAADWPWSSLRWRATRMPPGLVDSSPIDLPPDWLEFVNAPQATAELDRLRRSVRRGAPFGDGNWVRRVAYDLGLEATLRPRGRPPKPRPS